MADKYVDVSLTTGNNDGTSLANAWQSFTAVVTNTMGAGSVTAGDVIHVRTHDGTTDLGITLGANLTSAIPTSVDNPTTLKFDNGTVWANGGVFKISIASAGYMVNLGQYLQVLADGENRRFEISTSFSYDYHTVLRCGNGYYEGVKITNASLSTVARISLNFTDANVIFKDLYLQSKVSLYYGNFVDLSYSAHATFINLTLDYASMTPATGLAGVFAVSSYGGTYRIIGGKILGAFNGLRLLASTQLGTGFHLQGFDVGLAGIHLENYMTAAGNSIVMSAMGCESPLDACYYAGGAVVEYKEGNNQPTLNATHPDATNTPFSLKIFSAYPQAGKIAALPVISKFFSQASAIKKVTLEVLLHENLESIVNANNFFMVVQYFDANGDTKIQTTKGVGLTTSTASWSALTYGAENYSRYKLELTTTAAIKSGTKVACEIYCSFKAVSPTDFFFIDPDLTLTDV